MLSFWVVLWSVLLPPARVSGLDHCTVHESSSLHHESLLLNSLQCYNDYQSYVHCEWREHRRTTLQLWFKTEGDNEQCVPHTPAVQHASENGTFQCRYKTRAFSIGIKHTVFFLETTPTVCSRAPHEPLDLSQHLRTRPPVNLSTHDAGDGGRRLSWSSPYPASSALNKHITYQLSYRADRQDNWTTEVAKHTSVKLEKRLLLPGRRYEARTRAQASLGQWSDWSPVVTWQTEEDPGQFPSLHCVLDGEKEVVCSWKVSTELAHFITYQLACRYNRTAPSERCCLNPAVSSDHSRKVLKYSCSLSDADPARLLLELLPTRTAKTFRANQHIRPNPPEQVKVREEGSNWKVDWTDPSTALKLSLYYQVCYYSMQDQGSSIQLNISEGSKPLTILGASLAPLQRYQVKVRSLVVPGEDSIYGGLPSEWTDPVDWTSHKATWSLSMIYCFITVFVATVFFTLYCTIPACQRRVILWVDSVPSPGKSKILSELKSATSRTLVQSESTSICKVQHSDSASTRSSVILLWPTKETENKKHLEQDEGCWSCETLPSPAENVNTSVSSSMSFSGPYIFCQSTEQNSKPVDVKCDEKGREKETPSSKPASPSPVNFTRYGEGYVCLPSRNVSRSTQDLVSHSDANTSTQQQQQQQQQGPDTPLWPDKMDVQPGPSEPISSHQPPAYTSGPFIPWPQGDATQASGYCHIPTAPMRAAK